MREGDWSRGESERQPLVEVLGVIAESSDRYGGGVLTGKGNRGPLFFLRLGRRKKVVVVDMVCVVVVVA